MTTGRAAVFEARRVSKSYRQGSVIVPALNAVSLAVHAGDFVVLAGPSGSGKTTLLNLLGGIDLPSDGEVAFEGQSLTRATERDRVALRRRRLGFIFQAFNLVPVLTAYENVEYGLWLNGVTRSERRARVESALAAVGLADRQRHRPDHLSGGERQRVALARAFVHRPAAILADEPTASLDHATGLAMIDLLLQLNAALGTTFVVATHDPAIMARAPRVLQFQDGRLADSAVGGLA